VKPIVCLITDRRHLGTRWESALIARVAVAARAGVHLIQIRERDLDAATLADVTGECLAAVRGTPARVVVNDRLDVALAAGADGVHLRADSMDAARVRRLVPRGFIIGRSIHTLEEAIAASSGAALDYLIFGNVFETGSKPGLAPAGLERLARVTAATTIPVLAVGGMSLARMEAVARAGACGVAAIGIFADCEVEDVAAVMGRMSEAFDRPERLP
jgi:thiamine-phosphate pyrophosphorylase